MSTGELMSDGLDKGQSPDVTNASATPSAWSGASRAKAGDADVPAGRTHATRDAAALKVREAQATPSQQRIAELNRAGDDGIFSPDSPTCPSVLCVMPTGHAAGPAVEPEGPMVDRARGRGG